MMTMTYEMPKLPYANNALEPVISQQTIDFHYGKHLQTYVNNLNSLVPGTEYEGKTVEEIVATAPDGAIFRPVNWEKPSTVTLAALKTSRKNSMQQQSDCSVQDGPGCQ